LARTSLIIDNAFLSRKQGSFVSE